MGMLLLASYDVLSLRKMRSVSLLTSGLVLSVCSFSMPVEFSRRHLDPLLCILCP
jgi:hypothetical protein